MCVCVCVCVCVCECVCVCVCVCIHTYIHTSIQLTHATSYVDVCPKFSEVLKDDLKW